MAHQHSEWRHSGSECCTPFSGCLKSWCCPCVVAGKTHYRLKNGSNMDGYSTFNGYCCAHISLTVCGFGWVLQMLQRGEVRNRYGISGNGCSDCLCACCCAPCDLLQQEKETSEREDERAGLVSKQPGRVDQMNYH